MAIEISSKYPFIGAADSRIGGRNENQDTVGFSDTPLGLLVLVCDGMGGGPGGKTASLIATKTIIDAVKASKPGDDRMIVLERAIDTVQSEYTKAINENPMLKGMGSTVVALLINSESAVVANVGDSRCFKMKGRELIFRSRDHSWIAERIREKKLTEEQGRLSAQANIITRALGAQNHKPELYEVAFEKGDTFVLCSDGIWGVFPQRDLLRRFSCKSSPLTMVSRLASEVDAIGQQNGNHHDNLTIAIVKTQINSNLKEQMTKKSKLIIMMLAVVLALSLYTNLSQLINKPTNERVKAEVERLEGNIHEKDSILEVLKDSISNLCTQQKVNSANMIAELSSTRSDNLAKVDSLKDVIRKLESQVTELKSKQTKTKDSKQTNNRKRNIDVDKYIEAHKVTIYTELTTTKKYIKGKLDELLNYQESSGTCAPNKGKLIESVKGDIELLAKKYSKSQKLKDLYEFINKNVDTCVKVDTDGNSTGRAKKVIRKIQDKIDKIQTNK